MYNLPGMLFGQAMMAMGEPVKQDLEKNPELKNYDRARATQGYDDNGKMVFTYVDKYGIPFRNKDGSNMTIAKEDVGNLFIPKSPKRDIIDVLVDPELIGKNAIYGVDNFKNEINRSVNANIKDKNTFLDIAFYHSPNTSSSLADSLNGIEYGEEGVSSVKETKMFTVLMDAIGSVSTEEKNKLDTSGDNLFTEADYATQENLDALIKKVLSGDNLELGKALIKQHRLFEVETHLNKANEVNTPVVYEETEEITAIDDIIKKATNK